MNLFKLNGLLWISAGHTEKEPENASAAVSKPVRSEHEDYRHMLSLIHATRDSNCLQMEKPIPKQNTSQLEKDAKSTQPVGGYTQIYQQRVAPDSHIKKKINHFLVKNITILHIKKEWKGR